ncbi:MAG: electron transfer flavoprotein subunit alpha/FixB family protein [Fimbriimonadia bacterium]|jgi:electron transfer flavoprotein alpha subunit
MSRLLVIAETNGSTLLPATGAACSFAQLSGLPFDLLAIGSGVTAGEYGEMGAEHVLLADAPRLAKPLADRYAAVVAEVFRAGGYSHACLSSTTFGRDLLPRVAVLVGAPMLSDVLEIVDMQGGVFRRPMYAGAVIATVRVATAPLMLSIRHTAFPKPETRTTSVVKPVNVGELPTGMEWESEQTTSTGRPDLTQARVVVSGGRPLKDAATFEEHIGALADLLGGAVGATRAAVDAGIVGNDLQVGQTGKMVAPDLYFAIGISGSTQHLAGMSSSKVIVAINKDPEAPVFEVADYGLVADLFTAVPELKSKLRG